MLFKHSEGWGCGYGGGWLQWGAKAGVEARGLPAGGKEGREGVVEGSGWWSVRMSHTPRGSLGPPDDQLVCTMAPYNSLSRTKLFLLLSTQPAGT